MVYLWPILLVAADLVHMCTQACKHSVPSHTPTFLARHTYTECVCISHTQCGAALLQQSNLLSDAVILLQFSHAQLPLDQPASWLIQTRRNDGKREETKREKQATVDIEFERRPGVKLGHEEAQERKKAQGIRRQRTNDKRKGGGEEKVRRVEGSLSRENITLKDKQ